MIPVISANEMRKCDKNTILKKINEIDLINEAALAIYKHVKWFGEVLILVGSGNNGADGLALAKILLEKGLVPTIHFVKDKLSESGLFYYELIKNDIKITKNIENLEKYDIIVDGIIGNGFSGTLKGDLRNLVEKINQTKAYIVSIDINTGLSSENGVTDLAIKSDITISLGYFKYGHFLNDAKDYIKELVNETIGIDLIVEPSNIVEEDDIMPAFPKRLNNSNKGNYGYVGIMGGSSNYPGAVKLATLGENALYAGCGVARVIVPDVIKDLLFKNTLEATVYPVKCKDGFIKYDEKEIKKALSGLKALAIGPGLGQGSDNEKILSYILNNYELPVVIDADGINTLSKMNLEILNTTKCDVILTPHLKELSRLTNLEINEIKENLVKIAKEFTNKYNVTLLIKGPTTIVSKKGKVYFINKGCPGMATAGSGDVLTGIIVGMLGYNTDSLLATIAGSYINGLAGEMASLEYGDISMVSSDTARCVSKVIHNIIK